MMSKWIYLLIITLALISGLLVEVEATLIKLFDSPHFYELSTNRDANVVNGNNFSQLFTTQVFGDGRCGPKALIQYASNAKYDPAQGSEIGKLFMFSAKPVIYSNDEQTLSFLIDVQFQAPQISDIKGFEIGIEFQEHKSCVQIVPLGKTHQTKPAGRGGVTSYRFKIKDPVFMTIKQDKYTFYFGRANIRALIDCGGDKTTTGQHSLCAAENTISPSVDIGVLKIKDVDISNLRPDLCTGHLMTQTCIMRYKPEDSFVVIMHPMPPQFDQVIADMDILTFLDQNDINKDLKLGERALPDPNKINYIESFHRQKMPNNIVFKFLNYPGEYLNYMSIVKKPVANTTCPRLESEQKVQCECNQTCVDCYDYPNPKNELHYISLSKNSPKSYLMKSLHCSNEIYQAYNFDNIELAKYFQNQRLDKHRLLQSESSENSLLPVLPVYNKDSLPRMCFDFYANKKTSPINPIYQIKMLFNDVAKIAQSAIYNAQASFKLVLFKYEFPEKPDHSVDLSIKKLYKIHLKEMVSADSLNLTSALVVSGLKQGKYLVEVTPTMKNPLCANSADMCIDELNRNNQFACVECSKLIFRFELSANHFSQSDEVDVAEKKASDWSSRFEQLEKKLKSTFNLGGGGSSPESRQVDVQVASVADLGSSFIESDDLYHCSEDSADFQKIIAQSASLTAGGGDHLGLAANSSQVVLSSSLFRKRRAFGANDASSDVYLQFEISSTLVKKSFDIRNLMLPYEASFASEAAIVESSTYSDSLTNVFLLMSVIILMLILFIVFNLVYSRLRKQMILNNFKKTVVFYLSVFVDEKTQKEMVDLIKIYEKFCKKWLPSSDVFVITYATQSSEREQLLNKADRIFYVCGTENEIRHLFEPIHIGQNTFHHDYNRLHFVDKYRHKCTNITFNKNASILSKLSSSPSSSGTLSFSNHFCAQSCQIACVLESSSAPSPMKEKENLHTIINVGVDVDIIEAGSKESPAAATNSSSQREKKALLTDHGGLDDSIESSNRNSSTLNKDTSTSQLSSSSLSPASICSNSFTLYHHHQRGDDLKKYLKLPAENKLLIKLILCEEDCYGAHQYQHHDSCDDHLSSLSNYASHVKLGRFTLKFLLAKMEYDINQRVRRHLKSRKCLLKLDKNVTFNEQPLNKDLVIFEEEQLALTVTGGRNSNTAKLSRVSFKN